MLVPPMSPLHSLLPTQALSVSAAAGKVSEFPGLSANFTPKWGPPPDLC